MKKFNLVIIGIIIISFLVSIYFYPQMPDQIASHWDATGQVNGYMPKFLGMFLMPVIVVGLAALFLIIPKIDPLKKNIKKFMNHYEGFIIVILTFMLFIHVLTILWNIGIQFDMTTMVMIPMAILFYYLGMIMPHLKKNWFIGIRTPWTLSNEKVWKKTHELSGKLYKILAVFFLIFIILPANFFIYVVGIIIAISLYPIIYSYFEYQKQKP